MKGGKVPVDSEAKYVTEWDKRFWKDSEAQQKLDNTISVDELDWDSMDIIYFVGGWVPNQSALRDFLLAT